MKQLFGLVAAMFIAVPNLVAQVDLQRSFYVMRNDSLTTGRLEGGEWLIRFSDTDSLGNQYPNPVAMNIEAAYYGDTLYVPIQAVDSVLFEAPEDEMKPGVFELTEDHFKYIIGSDSMTTINFRIDCLTKVELPRVGQKIICNIFRGHLPFGFIGQVESIKASYETGYIQLKAKPIPLSEVYSKYYRAGFSGSDSLNAEAKRRGGFVAQQRRLDPVNRTEDLDELEPGMHFGDDVEPWGFKGALYIITKKSENKGFEFSYATFGNTAPSLKAGESVNVKLEADVKGTKGVRYSLVINEEKELDECEFEKVFTIDKFIISPSFTLSGKTGVGLKKPLVDDKDFGEVDISKVLCPFLVPTPVPGLTVNVDIGLRVEATFAALLDVNFDLGTYSKIVKANMVGDDVKMTLVDGGTNIRNKLSFSPSGGYLYLQGKIFTGVFGEIGIGLLGKALELQVKAEAGLELDASFGFSGIGSDGYLGYYYSEIERGKEICDSIVNQDRININGGIRIDGIASLGPFTYSAKELLGLKNDPLMFNLYTATSVPKFEFRSLSADYKQLKFELANIHHLFFDSEVWCFLKESYKGEDLKPLIEKHEVGVFKNRNTLNTTINVPADKRGIMVDVYPYCINKFAGKTLGDYLLPGVFESAYLPHNATIKDVQPDYGNLYVEGAIDDDVSDDAEMLHYEDKEVGIILYDKNKNEIVRLLEPAKESGNKIERTFDSNDCEGITEGYVATAVYDDNHKYTSKSRLVPFKILDIYDPKTLDPENVTTSGATVYAELHEVLVDQVKKGQVTDVEVGFHIQKYTGESSDVWTNAITIPFTDTRYSYQFVDLEPGLGYQYYAMVRKNKDVIYRGQTKSFTTLQTIQGLDASNYNSSSTYLFAEIAKSEDFKTTSFRFQVSREKDNWENAKEIYPKDSDWDFNSETEYYPVSVLVTGLKSETKYYYRVVWERNGSSVLHYSETMSFVSDKVDIWASVSPKVKGNSVTITATISQDLHDREPDYMYFVVATKKDYDMGDSDVLTVTVPYEKDKLNYKAEFSGLEYDKTYYCSFVAGTVVEEWAVADIKSFKTGTDPVDAQSCITLDPVIDGATVTFVGKINDANTLALFRSEEYPNSVVGFELFKGEGLTNADSDYIVFEVDKSTGEFRSEGNVLHPNTKYTYRAFVNLTGDKRVYSDNYVTFQTEKIDGDLIIPDGKKRQNTDEQR